MKTLPVPASAEAEEGVLACLLFNPRNMDKIADIIEATHFQNDANGVIFTAMQSLYLQGRPCNISNVFDEIKRANQITAIGGHAEDKEKVAKYRLDDLLDSLGTLGNIEDYAAIVKRTYTMRQLIIASQEIADKAYHQEPDALDVAEDLIAKIALGAGNKPVATLADAADRYMHDYTQRRKDFLAGKRHGVSTGFTSMDNLLGGLLPSKLYILAARPSIGKTALSLNVALNIVKQAKHAIFFSGEMKEDEIMQRLFSMETSIDQSFLRDANTNDDEDTQMRRAHLELRKLDLKVDDSSYLLSEIRTKARQVHNKKKLDLIVVDYLQLIDAQAETKGRHEMRYEEVGKLSKGLKRLAGDLKVPVLALAQLNRKSTDSELPQLHHLGESSKIEQDADVVMMIHCSELEETKRNENKPYELTIIVRKHRNGRIGQVPLMFRPRLTKFDDKAPEGYDDVPRY